MQGILRSIAWFIIFVLAALFVFFVIKVLTQSDDVFDNPTEWSTKQSFTSAPSTNSYTTGLRVTPPIIEPISSIVITNNEAIEKNHQKIRNEEEDGFRKKIIKDLALRLDDLIQNIESISPKELDIILADMSVLNDENGLVGGVNLYGLRETLKITEEIQTLALEILAESELGENANLTKLIEQSKKMEEFQHKLLQSSNFNNLLPDY